MSSALDEILGILDLEPHFLAGASNHGDGDGHEHGHEHGGQDHGGLAHHHDEEVRSLADRILVIYEGKIVGEFPPDATEEELGFAMTGGKAAA